MAGDPYKISVVGKHGQIVAQAELGQQGIDYPDLNTPVLAAVSQVRCPDVIVAVRHHERHRGKMVQYLLTRLRARKTLQDFLKDETCRNNCLAGFDGLTQSANLSHRRGRIAPKRKRPNAGIHEERQSRLRSAL